MNPAEHHRTPLHTAVEAGDWHAIDLLLKAGTDANVLDQEHVAAVDLLVHPAQMQTAAEWNSPHTQTVIERLLVASQPTLRAPREWALSALHHFLRHIKQEPVITDAETAERCENLVFQLLRHGANPHAGRNRDPLTTPLGVMVVEGMRETPRADRVMRALLGAGAAVEPPESNGYLHHALDFCYLGIMEPWRQRMMSILLEAGANPYRPHSNGKTVLDRLAEGKHTGLIGVALRASALEQALPEPTEPGRRRHRM